jgi:hypothetical protein
MRRAGDTDVERAREVILPAKSLICSQQSHIAQTVRSAVTSRRDVVRITQVSRRVIISGNDLRSVGAASTAPATAARSFAGEFCGVLSGII